MSQDTDATNEKLPSWMSAENDDKHREETMPLFGTGEMSLQDPEAPSSSLPAPKEEKDTTRPLVTTAESEGGGGGKPPASYGATDIVADAADWVGSGPVGKKKNTTTTNTNTNTKDGTDVESKTDWAVEGGTPAAASTTPAEESTKKPDQNTNDDNNNDVDDNDDDEDDDESGRPHRPDINPCLWLFHLLKGVAIVTELCLMATQIVPLVLVDHGEIIEKLGLLNLALKLYIAVFCLLFVLVESDVPVPVLKSSPLMQHFFPRGLVYSFLGLICVEEAYSVRVKDIVEEHGGKATISHQSWAAIFMQLSSWFMCGIGCVYMLLGVCCLKRIRDRMTEREKEQWKQYRDDLKEWKKQQKQLKRHKA